MDKQTEFAPRLFEERTPSACPCRAVCLAYCYSAVTSDRTLFRDHETFTLRDQSTRLRYLTRDGTRAIFGVPRHQARGQAPSGAAARNRAVSLGGWLSRILGGPRGRA